MHVDNMNYSETVKIRKKVRLWVVISVIAVLAVLFSAALSIYVD